jgi:hypothetical protein
MKKGLFLMLCVSLGCPLTSISQTLGGNAAYNFLKFSPSPQLSALGGVNISNINRDISLSFHNPSLLREDMHGQFSANFTSFYAGIKNIHALAGYRKENWATNFSAAVDYFHYGTTTQTDASGNVMGTFNPSDYVVQLSASRKYLERWYYGAAFKFIHSSYGQYRSSAIAVDFGLNYYDSSSLLQIGFAAKNMGSQIQTYAGTPEDMPFDLQLGITKRLKGSPFQFSVTAQRLQTFDILYNDTLYNANNGAEVNNGFFNKLIRHFIFGTQVFVGDKLEFTVGYNVLRRAELSVVNSSNGLTGICFGAGVTLKKFQFRYGRAQYQSNTGVNQIGINVILR